MVGAVRYRLGYPGVLAKPCPKFQRVRQMQAEFQGRRASMGWERVRFGLLLIRDLKTDVTTWEKADFVLPAIGRFNAWKLLDIPGISEYRGHLRHASNWDPSLDVSGKSVAVIGSGASGIQLVSNNSEACRPFRSLCKEQDLNCITLGRGRTNIWVPTHYTWTEAIVRGSIKLILILERS